MISLLEMVMKKPLAITGKLPRINVYISRHHQCILNLWDPRVDSLIENQRNGHDVSFH